MRGYCIKRTHQSKLPHGGKERTEQYKEDQHAQATLTQVHARERETDRQRESQREREREKVRKREAHTPFP